MEIIQLNKINRQLVADIALDGSKSISNRALIILALSGVTEVKDLLHNLSTSKDTVTLGQLLAQKEGVYNAGDAGTTFRFLTAYFAVQPGVQILDGSARMRERPIGGLVEALRSIGATVDFLEKEGYPPLRIGEMQSPVNDGTPAVVRIDAGISSQFLSALLLIGPYLPGGLQLIPQGQLVSRPYLEMTLKMMRSFGATAEWQGDSILVASGAYQPKTYTIEADWSAASYWYSMAVFADSLNLKLRGLFADSPQGDSVLAVMMQKFGIHTTFETDGVRLQKSGLPVITAFEWDFLECPDIAQTLAVVCAGMGVPGFFSGLETLAIKETDRITALKQELAKTGVSFAKLPARMYQKTAPGKIFYMVEGKANLTEMPQFATYGDHRMAMSFAPLAFLGKIAIENPGVVAKSYPQFWEHTEMAGVYAGSFSPDDVAEHGTEAP